MTPRKPTTASPKKRKDSLPRPSNSGSAKKRKESLSCHSGGAMNKKEQRSDIHEEGPGISGAEKFQIKVRKQHEAKNKGKEPVEEDDFNVVDNTLENQKILIENGHCGPKRKNNPKKVGDVVLTSIDSWFTDTTWSQVKPPGGAAEVDAHADMGEGDADMGEGDADMGEGDADMGEGDADMGEGDAADVEGGTESDVEVTPQKKQKIYETGGKGRKPCGGGCGKFVPAVSKYETCVTNGKPVRDVEKPPIVPKIYDNGGKGRKPCKGGCGKYIPSVAKNEKCVSTGEVITESKKYKHVFDQFPGSVKKDIGQAVDGAIVTANEGDKTGQTLFVPVYDEMDENEVKKRVAMLEIGNLVDSKKKAYAMTYTLDGSSFVKTVLADDIEKLAEDSAVYELYGHVTNWVGRLEGENIVLLEEISDPIVNPYWTDISLFFPKETQDIGGLEVEDVMKADDIFKLSIGGWKKDDDEFQVAVSGRIFAFGEDDGVDLNMIIYTPILMLMPYDAFCEKLKGIEGFGSIMSMVEKNDPLVSDVGLAIMRYSIMENGWVVRERLKEYLNNVLKNAD